MSEKRFLKGLYIDPENNIAEMRILEDSLPVFYDQLRCSMIEMPQRSIGLVGAGQKRFTIVCDEDGLYKERQFVSALDIEMKPHIVGPLFVCAEEGFQLTSLTDGDLSILLSCNVGKVMQKAPDGNELYTTVLLNVGYDMESTESVMDNVRSLSGLYINPSTNTVEQKDIHCDIESLEELLCSQYVSVIRRSIEDREFMIFVDNGAMFRDGMPISAVNNALCDEATALNLNHSLFGPLFLCVTDSLELKPISEADINLVKKHIHEFKSRPLLFDVERVY